MNNKKIILSLLLVVLIALSVSAVSAAEDADAVAADESADAIAVDDAADVLSANTWKPTGTNASAVQDAVNSASDGDTIDLSDNVEYDFGASTVTISGKNNIIVQGNSNTIIRGHGAGNGIFYVTESAAVTFKGISFIDNNPKNNITYMGNVAGWGVNFDGQESAGGVVDNCSFKDFNQAVVVNACNHVTVKNSHFTGGIATKIINDPTVNKEQGSKVISVGGSFYTNIINNTFDGPVLDSVSIAKQSGDAQIIGNTFTEAVYAIFFGGASTEGTSISDNTFIRCGQFVLDNGTVWGEMPVISIEKASDSINLDNNTFYAVNNNKLIAAESSNTAHGAPSSLGNINVTNSKVILADDTVVARSVTLLHILSRQGDINPFAPIRVTGNTFAAGVRPVVVWYNDWGKEDSSNIVIPQAPEPHVVVATNVTASNLNVYAGDTGALKITLKDADGNAVADKTVSVIIDGVTKTVTTDGNGTASFAVKYASAATKYATVSFLGDDDYKASIATAKINVVKKATVLTAPKAVVKVKVAKKIAVTLKSAGKALAGKRVTIKVNGKTFAGVTNAKGVATIAVKVFKKGNFKYTASFAGDGAYKPVNKVGIIVAK